MRPDKTKPRKADQTRKQQAGSELIQANQTKAYQDQSGTDQRDWATPRHRDQKTKWSPCHKQVQTYQMVFGGGHDSTTQT